jgi:hypothetical protein
MADTLLLKVFLSLVSLGIISSISSFSYHSHLNALLTLFVQTLNVAVFFHSAPIKSATVFQAHPAYHL